MESTKKIIKISFFAQLTDLCRGWLGDLRSVFSRNEVWTSHLVEYYCIYKQRMEEEYVKDWLHRRESLLKNNRYRIVINTLKEECPEGVVGHVLLYSKGRLVQRATLKMRDGGCSTQFIFWSFAPVEHK